MRLSEASPSKFGSFANLLEGEASLSRVYSDLVLVLSLRPRNPMDEDDDEGNGCQWVSPQTNEQWRRLTVN